MRLWAVLLLAVAIPGRAQPSAEFTPAIADLQSCVGRYQASADTIVTVRCDGDRLNLMVNSGSAMEFTAQAKDRFVNAQSGTKIQFVRDDRGAVKELVLERDGEHRAKRLADITETSAVRTSEQVRHVDVDGRAFRVVMSGDGKGLVVLVSGVANWLQVAEGLRGQARVFRYEENGIRPVPRGPLDVKTQIKVLHDLLTTLEVARPLILVGWSYEGALVRLYAGAYPEEVGGLVLVDPFDESFVDWLKANQPQNYELFRQHGTERYVSDWDNFTRRLREAQVPKSIPVALLTAGHRQIREGDALETQIDSADFRQGEMALSRAHEARIAKIPKGRLVVVPNAGHDIPGEQPDSVVRAIQEELKAMGQRGK